MGWQRDQGQGRRQVIGSGQRYGQNSYNGNMDNSNDPYGWRRNKGDTMYGNGRYNNRYGEQEYGYGAGSSVSVRNTATSYDYPQRQQYQQPSTTVRRRGTTSSTSDYSSDFASGGLLRKYDTIDGNPSSMSSSSSTSSSYSSGYEPPSRATGGRGTEIRGGSRNTFPVNDKAVRSVEVLMESLGGGVPIEAVVEIWQEQGVGGGAGAPRLVDEIHVQENGYEAVYSTIVDIPTGNHGSTVTIRNIGPFDSAFYARVVPVNRYDQRGYSNDYANSNYYSGSRTNNNSYRRSSSYGTYNDNYDRSFDRNSNDRRMYNSNYYNNGYDENNMLYGDRSMRSNGSAGNFGYNGGRSNSDNYYSRSDNFNNGPYPDVARDDYYRNVVDNVDKFGRTYYNPDRGMPPSSGAYGSPSSPMEPPNQW